METRANYVLIGAFTVLLSLGLLGMLLWFAKVEVDRQYAYYDVLFEDVSGLSEAASVRFNGLRVGSVVRLRLDPDDPSEVRVTLEVAAETPVRTDTVAVLQLQGVTGVSFVALSGGSAEAPLLREAHEGEGNPVIPSRVSAVQSVLEGAPELLERAIGLIDDLDAMVGPENREAIDAIVRNLASASERLDGVMADVSGLSGDLSSAAGEVAAFTARLESLSAAAEGTLATADETLSTATGAIRRAEGTMDAATGTMEAAGGAFARADALMAEELPGLIAQGRATAEAVERAVTRLEGEAATALAWADALMGEQLPGLIAQGRAKAEAVERAVTRLEGEAATALASADALMGERLPAMTDQVTATASMLERQAADLGGRAGTA